MDRAGHRLHERHRAGGGGRPGLVNNAGGGAIGPTPGYDEDVFNATFGTNVKAPFYLVSEIAPAMAGRGQGAIVNVVTMAAQFGIPGMAVYGGGKAALTLMTKSWAAEFYGEVMAGSGAAQRGSPAGDGRRHPGLSHRDVLASGGWHPRYARVLITASEGDYGFALVDGNGDGAELEEELWQWEDGPGGHGRWEGGSSSGAGPLGHLPPLVAGGHIGPAYLAYGHVPGRESVTVEFEERRYEIPVSPLGVWGFIREAAGPHPGLPALVS